MENNKRIIEEINRYCNPFSILVIDKHGILRRIQCPFKVIIVDVSLLKFLNKDIVMVEAVKVSDQLILLYQIQKLLYPYHLFAIIL